MDRASNDTSTTNGGRPRAPKSRNSDIRKEQNRVASRAYREKRKKKLALLDELLKSDSHTDSMSSVSDEMDGHHTPLSIAHSRHASNSPAPVAPSIHPSTAHWAATTQAMASNAPSYSQETYADCWMNSFDHSQDIFTPGTDYLQSFIPTDVASNSLRTASQYAGGIQSIAPMSSAPSVALDPALSDSHLTTYHTYSTHNGSINNSPYIPAYDDGEISGLENDMIHALESLSKLSYSQQQHVFDLVQKRRSLSYSTTSDHSLDYSKYADYQMAMPPTDGNKHRMATRQSKHLRT
ncbi:hypothetical protein F4775DRAFT_431058 [Biscogniauxia sp. FL1348]|nr:hypothetical protein F4775DRAFT_431058 [Biscogniauxia sp. FL1348]